MDLLADLINNPKIPKFIRITIVTILVGLLEALFIGVAVGRGTIYAMPVGIFLAVIFVPAYIYLLFKIIRSEK